MQCPKCQFVNREGVRFCEECGTKMVRVCPGCGTKAPPVSKFCGECGRSLSSNAVPDDPGIPQVLPPADPIARLKRYLPTGLEEAPKYAKVTAKRAMRAGAYTDAIAADERNRTRWYLGQDYAVYSDVCRIKGDVPQAQAHLMKSIEIYRECGADGWVNKYEKELSALQ